MSDIERRMAEWRKNVWGAGPCPESSQENSRLTDAEREAVKSAIWDYAQNDDDEDCARMVATLESLLERMA